MLDQGAGTGVSAEMGYREGSCESGCVAARLVDNLSCFTLHRSRSKLSTYTLSSPHNSMPSQSLIPLTTPRGMHWRYRRNEVEGSCECGCAPTSCHNLLELRKQKKI